MKQSLQVVYVDPGAAGYHCVHYMAQLAAELLEGELVLLQPTNTRLIHRLLTVLPRGQGEINCLLICPSPHDLSSILEIDGWRHNYAKVIAWVFDSFWTENIPSFTRWSHIFHKVFLTEGEDLDTWRKKVPVSVDWLPWGSDVLRLGSDNPYRHCDLLRFGRQPSQWDNDATTASACEKRGILFSGRPGFEPEPIRNQRSLMKALQNTKLALAFSNRVSPNPQTHPTREYLTGRWTDALSSGAIVAGVPPRSPSATSLLWPEAALDLGNVELQSGIDIIFHALSEWTEDRANINYVRALERLDWRWRFKRIADTLGIRPPSLERELTDLQLLLTSTPTSSMCHK